MLPKYIEGKINRLNKLLNEAYLLKNDIESWAEKKGADTSSIEWYDIVINDCNMINGFYKEGIEEYFKNIKTRDNKLV